MIKAFFSRLKQKYRTEPFPKKKPLLPERFRGRPLLDPARCPAGCRRCLESCPYGVFQFKNEKIQMDLGRCLFCADCISACPSGAVRFSQDFRLAVSKRENLIFEGADLAFAQALGKESLRLFGRSLRLRQVSAGGCNACEADTNVLTTLVFDLGRFGIDFVASPRHADGLLVTGPVTRNMKLALLKTYEAVPDPKIVIAVGACAISGGPFAGHEETMGGVDSMLPVDLYVPGCPPHPYTILDGLLRLLGRIK